MECRYQAGEIGPRSSIKKLYMRIIVGEIRAMNNHNKNCIQDCISKILKEEKP